MKQHITPAQLNELSPAAKERLRAWWKPRYAYTWHGVKKSGVKVPDFTTNTIPFLTLGQMIEFIFPHQTVIISCDDREGFPHTWRACGFDRPELCDALWAVCQKILENDRSGDRSTERTNGGPTG